MPPRIIVHAGFHKTGTTSIQKALRAARTRLAPVRLLLRPDMISLCNSARAYSVSHSDLDLGLVQYEAALLAEDWQGTVLLSSEDLTGHMPGRRGVTGYDATPRLMQTMAQAWRAAHPEAQIAFVFTTRAPEPWLASCHMQHLRATRITLTAQEYAARYARSADLAQIIERTIAAVPGHAVHRFALGGTPDPLVALLDLVGIDPGTLPPMPHLNRSDPDALRTDLLAINRSDRTEAEARAARKALMKQGRT